MGRRFSIRSYSRFPVECPIYFLGDRFLGKGTVLDLSRVGWRVDGDHVVQAGIHVALRVFLPDQDSPVRIDRAAVRWSRGQEFGLEIMLMQPQEKARLRRFISGLVPRTRPAHV